MSASDAGSISSYGSSHASPTAEKFAQARKPGDGDEDVQSTWVAGLFGVLYTVSKEKDQQTWRFVTFRLVLDALQLFLLTVNPQYGWDIADTTGWRVVSFVQLNQFMTDRGYQFFLITFYIMVIALVAVVALCIWVGYSFGLSRFDYVWPITLLRWYANIFFQVLEVASMTLLLMALDCQYFDVKEGQQFMQQEFGVACWEMPHVIHVMVASGSLIIFVGLAALFQMAEMELNPLTRSYLAMGHSKVELQSFVLKVFATFASVFITNFKWLSIVYLVCFTILAWLYVYWQPQIYGWVNHVRAGSYCAVWYSALLLVPVAFKWGADEDLEDHRRKLTIALWAGIGPAALLGAAASYMRLRFFTVTILDRFKNATADTKPRHIYRFKDGREAEILARCCRQWVDGDDELLDQEAVKLAESVLKAGRLLLPKDAYMIILYSSFMIDVQTSYQSGYTQLQLAKRAEPSFLERFAIYSREQQHTQKSSGAGGGQNTQAVSLMSFVEFTKNYHLVQRVHREALVALRQFWQQLLHSDAELLNLTNAVKRVDQAVRNADRVYKMVLVRHAQNVKIVKLYARFLEDVKHDPWNASKWFIEAEKLEQAEEDARNGNMFAELGIDPASADIQALGDLGELLNMKGGILGAADSRAVIIINAQGTVQLVNPTVERMFGYSKNEIKGRNVSLVIPPPFAEHHTSFIRNYIQTGREVVMGQHTNFVAMHKERFVFGVQTHVTKIAGLGEDSLFMGIIQANPPAPGATIWIMVGSEAVVSCDSTFTDWFGYRAEELLGKGVDDWVVDAERLQSIFKGAKSGNLPSAASLRGGASTTDLLAQAEVDSPATAFRRNKAPVRSQTRTSQLMLDGRWFLSNATLRHKFADPCAADITITVGGIGSHKFFVCNVMLKAEPRMLIVSDRAGRVVHASQALASALNSTTKMLLGNSMPGALQNLLPQPFSTLHTQLLSTPLPQGAPPLHSCRAGALAMLLNTFVKDSPPIPKPFGLSLSRRELEGEQLFLASFKNMNMEEALDLQRIKLEFGLDGVVTNVIGGSSSVFGFDPVQLLEKQCSEFLDVLQGCGVSADGSNGLDKVLMALAVKIHDSPGTSFRVGVFPPVDRVVDALVLTDDLGCVIGAPKPKPAIMTVSVRFAARGNASPMRSLSKVVRRTSLTWFEGGEGVQRSNNGGVYPPGVHMPNGSGPHQDDTLIVGPTPNNVPTAPRAKRGSVGSTAAASISFVIELWRADVTAGVMEVDPTGHIVQSQQLPLFPAGLMFGVPSDAMLGQTLSTYLPMAEGKPPATMMEQSWSGPSTNGGRFIPSKPKPSSMKAPKGTGKHKNQVGALHTVQIVHHGDGDTVDLSLQAVRKLSGTSTAAGSQNVLVVIRMKNPQLGRPDFAKWLLQDRPTLKLRSSLQQRLVKAPTDSTEESNAMASAYSMEHGKVKSPAKLGVAGLLGPGDSLTRVSEHKEGEGEDWDYNALDMEVTSGGTKQQPPLMGGISPAMAKVMEGRESKETESSAAVAAADENNEEEEEEDRGMDSGALARVPSASRRGSGPSGSLRAAQIPQPPELPQPSTTSKSRRKLSSTLSKSPSKPASDAAHAVPAANGNGSDVPLDRITQWVMSGGHVADGAGPTSFASPAAQLSGNLNTGREGPRFANGAMSHDDDEDDRSSLGTASDVHPLAAKIREPGPGRGLPKAALKGEGAVLKARPPPEEQDRPESPGGHHEAGAHHDGSSEPVDATHDEEQIVLTDYRRGQRFKKLMRMLFSPEAQSAMQRFRLHSYCVAAAMVLVHLAMYVLQHQLLTQQQAEVTDLYSVGVAARLVGQILHSTREISLILANRTVPSLPGLSSYANLQAARDKYISQIEQMKVMHEGVYFGFGSNRRMPTEYNLRRMWDTDSILTYDIMDAYPKSFSYTRNMSLWNLGNLYMAKASNIWLNGQRYSWTNGSLDDWSEFKFMMLNAPTILMQGYYDTTDAFLQLSIKQADSINRSQMIVLIMEGMLVAVVGVTYMFILARSVTWQRYNLFTVFIMVPIGLIRALSTQPIVLDEEDEEALAEEAALRGQTGVAVGGAMGGGGAEGGAAPPEKPAKRMNRVGSAKGSDTGPPHTVKINVRMAADVAPDEPAATRDEETGAGGTGKASHSSGSQSPARKTWLTKLTSCFTSLWASCLRLKRGNKVTTGGKRRLVYTNAFALWLIWPFALWAAINIAINAKAQSNLQAVDGPIGTFNLVNNLYSRIMRTLHYAEELCSRTVPSEKALYRDRLGNQSLPKLKTLLIGMEWGASAVNDSSPLYALSGDGVMFSGGNGVNILFGSNQCLRLNQSSCPTNQADDVYWEYTHNGLDRLIRRFMDVGNAMFYSASDYPDLYSKEWDFVWNAKADIEGGLEMLVQSFHQYVNSVYNDTTLLHTTNFAISVVIATIYAFFILRPFINEVHNETRRVAELLSQLPAEISVEELVTRALALQPATPADPAGTGNNMLSKGGAGLASMKQMGSLKF